MIKSDNFTRSNKEKSNIAIAILEWLDGTIIFFFVVAIIFSLTVDFFFNKHHKMAADRKKKYEKQSQSN